VTVRPGALWRPGAAWRPAGRWPPVRGFSRAAARLMADKTPVVWKARGDQVLLMSGE
jgi:hypothetical protein